MSELSNRLFEIDEIARSPKSELLATFENLFNVSLDGFEHSLFHYTLVLSKEAVVYEQDRFGNVKIQYSKRGTFHEDNVISLQRSSTTSRNKEGFLLGIFTPQVIDDRSILEPTDPLICFTSDLEDLDISSYAVKPEDIIAVYKQSEAASHALRMLQSARADLGTDTSSYYMTRQDGWPVYRCEFMEKALALYWPTPDLVYLAEALPSET